MSLITSSSPSPPTLLTIPPELLLQILTHLPSSSSLHALSITSHTLNTFLHTHAATITNSLITSYHPISSQILRAQHTQNSAGFLVPTHPLVLTEERRIQRDKILSSGCRCPPCRLMLYTGTSSSSDLSLYSSSEHDGLVSCLPTLSMTTTRSSECKARTALENTTKLTEPGPQFLVFLERYGWEVEARWDVYLKQQQQPQQQPIEEEDEDVDEATPSKGEDGDASSKAFEFMIGNYCVRKFLEHAGKELENFRNLTPAKTNDTQTIKARLKTMLKKHCKKGIDGKKKVAASTRPSPRMFGEIEKSPATAVVEKDNWVKGLLWYRGIKSGMEETSFVVEDPVIGSAKTRKTLSKAKVRNCMAGMKASIRKIGSSMKGMLGHLRCAGQFQELDD